MTLSLLLRNTTQKVNEVLNDLERALRNKPTDDVVRERVQKAHKEITLNGDGKYDEVRASTVIFRVADTISPTVEKRDAAWRIVDEPVDPELARVSYTAITEAIQLRPR